MIPQRMALLGSLDYVSGFIINNTVRPERPNATSSLNHRRLTSLPIGGLDGRILIQGQCESLIIQHRTVPKKIKLA